MASHLNSREIPFGTIKLCQDIATLFNSRQGSDIQFRVGGGISTQESGETIYDESTTVTLHAHSLILRCRSSYFAAMLDEEKNWKESSNGVIYKPNISPVTFQDVLYYLYTGNVRASANIVELITAADEMDLEELSVECQNKLVRTVKYIFSEEDEIPTNQRIPIDVAVRSHIIPAHNLASSHSLSNLSQEVLTIILPHMSVIIKSPDAYTEFVSQISPEALVKIIASDDLAMTERDVWDLSLNWGCHQTKVPKIAMESHFSSPDDDEHSEESSDRTLVDNSQLNRLKEILAPLLPFIRFSLLNPEDYMFVANTLIYFLPHRRFLEITRFFVNPDGAGPMDTRRKNHVKQKIPSKTVIEPTALELLINSIFKKGDIAGCRSSSDLKFKLLFRASDHGFLSSAFHQRCDNKGPTLTIITIDDGELCGGVNFNDWKSDNTRSSSTSNFLFVLPYGDHEEDLLTSENTQDQYFSFNYPAYGPIFGTDFKSYLLVIPDSVNTNQCSNSYLPGSYDGSGASTTILFGSCCLIISDYEVFAISK